jgi:hypothetical protein
MRGNSILYLDINETCRSYRINDSISSYLGDHFEGRYMMDHISHSADHRYYSVVEVYVAKIVKRRDNRSFLSVMLFVSNIDFIDFLIFHHCDMWYTFIL